jgi:hypothetical protein
MQQGATPDAALAGLPPRVARAIDLLLGGATDAEVARALDVDRSTVWRWRIRPDVASVLAEGRRLRLDGVAERLRDGAHRAIDFLLEVLAETSHPVAVRLRAATEVLDRAGHVSSGAEGVQRAAQLDEDIASGACPAFAPMSGRALARMPVRDAVRHLVAVEARLGDRSGDEP